MEREQRTNIDERARFPNGSSIGIVLDDRYDDYIKLMMKDINGDELKDGELTKYLIYLIDINSIYPIDNNGKPAYEWKGEEKLKPTNNYFVKLARKFNGLTKEKYAEIPQDKFISFISNQLRFVRKYDLKLEDLQVKK